MLYWNALPDEPVCDVKVLETHSSEQRLLSVACHFVVVDAGYEMYCPLLSIAVGSLSAF